MMRKGDPLPISYRPMSRAEVIADVAVIVGAGALLVLALWKLGDLITAVFR